MINLTYERQRKEVFQKKICDIDLQTFSKRELNVKAKFIKSIIVLGLILSIYSCKKESNTPLSTITTFEGSIESLKGDTQETSLIKNFPKPFYQIYSVQNVGSFYVDNRVDIIKNQLRSGQIWENPIVEAMKKHIKPGSVAIDIGAHVGTHSLIMSKLTGKEGKVIAFEPQLKLFSELVMNMVLNQCDNVKAFRCAVGEEFRLVEMNPPVVDNEGGTKIGKGGDKAQLIPLDSLGLTNVSLIKVDVENYEYEVLLGAEKTIKENRPVIIIEIMGNIYQSIPNRQELVYKTLHTIEKMGYSVKYIDGSWSDWLATPL